MNILGKLTWSAIPFDQPIVMVATAMMILTIVSVLAYRAFAFWLPTVPGVVAYLQLRRTVHRWRGEAAAPALH